MADKLLIKGGNKLYGDVDIRGSKNAALPILAATILTKNPCRISNLPLVNDVYAMLDILKQMGGFVKWEGKNRVAIENRNVNLQKLNPASIKKMRASILVTGPILARFGKIANWAYPGGCSIGARSIETHLQCFKDLGAKIVSSKNSFSILFSKNNKIPKRIVLEDFSVTATENVIMFLSGNNCKSEIRIGAAEPHIQDLARFLRRMGAKIEGAGSHDINVAGSQNLKGASHSVVPDYIEAGTFIAAVLTAGGKIRIKNAPVEHLELAIKKLKSAGANIYIEGKYLVCSPGKKFNISAVQTLPYPGIPTDLQPLFCVLATQSIGNTLIHDPMYEKRLNHLEELKKMGAKIEILDPHRAYVFGPTKLRGASLKANDLRGGAALLVAAISANGASSLDGFSHVGRGYEDLVERLNNLGSSIKIV